jgi:hypothetical protein
MSPYPIEWENVYWHCHEALKAAYLTEKIGSVRMPQLIEMVSCEIMGSETYNSCASLEQSATFVSSNTAEGRKFLRSAYKTYK